MNTMNDKYKIRFIIQGFYVLKLAPAFHPLSFCLSSAIDFYGISCKYEEKTHDFCQRHFLTDSLT